MSAEISVEHVAHPRTEVVKGAAEVVLDLLARPAVLAVEVEAGEALGDLVMPVVRLPLHGPVKVGDAEGHADDRLARVEIERAEVVDWWRQRYPHLLGTHRWPTGSSW